MRMRHRPHILAPAIAVASLCAGTGAAIAHELDASPGPRNVHELLRTWGWEPGTLVPILLTGWLYAVGVRRFWRAAAPGHGIRRWEAICFAGGWLALVIALISPLHPWGQVLFSAHMTQHEILMLIAAPLLVLGRPMIAFLRALPPNWAGALARFGNARSWQMIWRSITNPLVAWIIHAIVLWMWHMPALFDATLHSEFVHALQHVSFISRPCCSGGRSSTARSARWATAWRCFTCSRPRCTAGCWVPCSRSPDDSGTRATHIRPNPGA